MGFESLMKRVLKRVENFSLKEETIVQVIELHDRWNEARYKTNIEGESEKRFSDIADYLSQLSDKELRELMCLSEFGRGLDGFGFCRFAAQKFIDYVDDDHFSDIKDPEYIVRKVLNGDWLRLAMEQIKAGTEPDKYFRIIMSRRDSLESHEELFGDFSSAWKAYRNLMTSEMAERYEMIEMYGFTDTDRAETLIIHSFFE